MSTINRENYEIYVVDFLEGSLAAYLQVELQDFLNQNLDLKQEFEAINSFDSQNIAVDNEVNFDFSFLKKIDDYAVLETKMIAAIEGDLSELELLELQNKIEFDPKLARDFKLFESSILEPENIVFEKKNSLKKGVLIQMPFNYRIASIAAVLVAFALAGVLYFGSNQKAFEKPNYATIHKVKPPVEQIGNLEKNKRKLVELIKGEQAGKSEIVKFVQPTSMAVVELKLKGFILKENRGEMILDTKTRAFAYLPPASVPMLALDEAQNYMKPTEWLAMKTKKLLLGNELQIKDTAAQVSVGVVALNLLEKTTGIAYHDRKDEESGARGFSIVSRFFAYERITH